MTRATSVSSFLLASLGFLSPWAASTSKAAVAGNPTGHEAMKAVRHDWKSQVHHTVHSNQASVGPVPAHFGRLSPEARLAYLLARRNENPARFDRHHPLLGPILGRDERLRAAQSQDCRPLNGLLPDNPHNRYLKYRRSLNPARFDIYHATIGAILAEDDRLKAGTGCVSPEIIPPPIVVVPPVGTPSPGPPVGGLIIPPRAVPEPSSLALIVLGSAGVFAPRLLRRWRHRPEPTND